MKQRLLTFQVGIIMVSPLTLKNSIIVAGHPRSGTSLVCQLLSSAGVTFPSDLEKDKYNTRGYYEMRSSKELSKKLIREAMTEENTELMNKIIRELREIKGKAGLKMVRVPAVFFYRHVAEDLQFIGVFRNPADVKASLFKRGIGAFSIPWVKNNNALIAAYENIESSLILSYESIISESSGLKEAFSKFGFQIDYDIVNPELQSQKESRVYITEDEKHLYKRLQALERESWEQI